ncbi:hypothetical protein C3F00_046175, partial [Pseudomonas sp. MWU13-2860]
RRGASRPLPPERPPPLPTPPLPGGFSRRRRHTSSRVQGVQKGALPICKSDVIVIVNADAKATHQSVVTVMEAAREAGLNQLTFATRTQ